MNETKSFPLRVVLSVTTGRLLCDFGELYEVLGWMTDDEPFTHQLPRFMRECQPWIERWHPDLAVVSERLPELDRLKGEQGEEGVEQWLQTQESEYGVERVLQKIPRDDHESRDPIQELKEMKGPDKVIVVETPEE